MVIGIEMMMLKKMDVFPTMFPLGISRPAEYDIAFLHNLKVWYYASDEEPDS